jgi:4-amino-4-deoxy-L-arabinose transferase-like glycosyltransferase
MVPPRFLYPFLIIVVSCLVLIPFLGAYYIQPTTDLWIQRSVHFYYAIKSGNWAGTYTMYHPGVTIMWLVGITSGLYFPIFEKLYGFVPNIFSFEVFPSYIFFATLSVVIMEILLLVVLYLVLGKILGIKIAFFSVLLLLLEPFFLGNARSIHMDTLVSILILISLSLYFLGVKYNKIKYLVFCGIFSGLGVLTRINSGIVLVFIFLWQLHQSFFGKVSWRISLKVLLTIGIFSILVFYALFPAMWFHPLETFIKVFNEGVFDTALGEESRRPVFLLFDDYSWKQKLLSYIAYIPFRLSPISLLLISWLFFRQKKIVFKKEYADFIKILLAFSFLYWVFISIPSKQIFRYVLPIFPIVAIFFAIYLNALKDKYLKIGAFSLQIVLVLIYYPNFFAYFNPLIGGISVASKVINLNQDATYYKEIADYLNSKENAKDLRVVMYDSNSFRMIFKGGAFMLKNFESQYGKKVDTDYVLLPLEIGKEFVPWENYHLEKVFKVLGFDYYYLYKKK